MNSENTWTMPTVNLGDVVLYSNDMHNFSNPCIGWVIKNPGSTTLQILTFTQNQGWVERPSVHHRDDPGIMQDNAWESLGVWDYTDTAKATMKHIPQKVSEIRAHAREQVTAK